MTERASLVGTGSPWLPWVLASTVLLIVSGAVLPLTDGDSAFYATVARDALKSGDWFVFSVRGGGVFDKPPLTTWLLELSIALFGSPEWAVRMWHVGLALATAFATYALARLALSRSQSLIAVFVLLTSGQFFYQSLVPQQDIPLTLFVTLAVYWYLRWIRDAQRWMAALCTVSIALAVLSKGLIGVVLPVLIVAAHLIVDRPSLPRMRLRDAAAAIVAFLLVAAPWFVAVGLRQGRAFVETFLLGGSLGIGRFFRPMLSTPSLALELAGLLAYVVFLPVGMLPWTGWVWPAFVEGRRARREVIVLRTCFLWAVAVLIFLSVAPGDKVIRFQLPVLPAVAILVAHVLNDDRWSHSAAWVSLGVAGLLAVALSWLFARPLPSDMAGYVPLASALIVPLAAGLASFAVAALRGRRQTGAAILAGLALAAYTLLVGSTVRIWDRLSPWRPIAASVNAIGRQDARVLVEGARSPFAEYYIIAPVEFVSHETLISVWRAQPVVAVIPAGELPALPASPPAVAVASEAPLVVVKNFP